MADDFALVFQWILIVVVALSIALSEKYVQTKGINYGEYYALLLFSTSGAMLMAASRELITIFHRPGDPLHRPVHPLRLRPHRGAVGRAAMKYFLLGAFSSGFFLYGIALVYGGTGTTRLDVLIPRACSNDALSSPYTVAGFALLIVGLGFKAAIVPFHSWTPDVYEGAPDLGDGLHVRRGQGRRVRGLYPGRQYAAAAWHSYPASTAASTIVFCGCWPS